MVIFKITNTKSRKSYYNLSLNGYSFAAKLRDILYGKSDRYNTYYPIHEDVENGDKFDIIVLEVNTPPEKINSRMIEYISEDSNNYNLNWVPLFQKTIEEHYQRIELWTVEQGQELYLDLVELFGYEMLTTIVFDYIYCHVNGNWLMKVFELSELELNIILKGLPMYINLMDFTQADKSLSHTEKRNWRGENNGLHSYGASRKRFRVFGNLE